MCVLRGRGGGANQPMSINSSVTNRKTKSHGVVQLLYNIITVGKATTTTGKFTLWNDTVLNPALIAAEQTGERSKDLNQ